MATGAMVAMRRFRIGSEIYTDEGPEFQAALADAYARKKRPLCLCREPGYAMYIAQIGDHYVTKRMPLSGGAHHPSCESYESPFDLSGLGVLMGNAIQLDAQTGTAALKLDFSLSRTGSRATPVSRGEGPVTVAGETKRLSLRGLLHYLWHEAELTVWTSRWAGKRHWWNVRWHLLEAAKQMTAKGSPLADILFVPEPFRSDNKEAIEQRRAVALSQVLPPKNGPRRLLVLIGEVKEVTSARAGQRLVIKHLPGFPFMLDDVLYRRFQTHFESELSLWGAERDSHLMAVATFGLNMAGVAMIEEIAVMVVSENWIPYENVSEKRLVDALARLREKSVKGMRYDLQSDQPIANALLPDRPQPVALFIIPAAAGEAFEKSLQDMMSSRPELGTWTWRVAEGDMPALP